MRSNLGTGDKNVSLQLDWQVEMASGGAAVRASGTGTGGSEPSGAGNGVGGPVLPPSPTLYVNNLNDRLRKDALKKALYELFVQCGPIFTRHSRA